MSSQDSRDPLSWAPPREEGGADSSYPSSGSPQLPTPVLLESQIQRLAESAERVAKTLPSFEPRTQNSKKKVCKELEVRFVMTSQAHWRQDMHLSISRHPEICDQA